MRFFIAALILLAVCTWAEAAYVCKYKKHTFSKALTCDAACAVKYLTHCLKACKKLGKSRAQLSWNSYAQEGFRRWHHHNAQDEYRFRAQDQEDDEMFPSYLYGRRAQEGYRRFRAQDEYPFRRYAQEESFPRTAHHHVSKCRMYCLDKAVSKTCHKL